MGLKEADEYGVGGGEELRRTKKSVNQSATPVFGEFCVGISVGISSKIC